MALILVDADDQVAMCQVASRWKMLRWILIRCPPSCFVPMLMLNSCLGNRAISGVRDGHRNRKSQESLRFWCAKKVLLGRLLPFSRTQAEKQQENRNIRQVFKDTNLEEFHEKCSSDLSEGLIFYVHALGEFKSYSL